MTQPTQQLSLDDISKIDKETLSPAVRGERVYSWLKKHPTFTNWDLLCFCAEYLASQAVINEFLMPLARQAIKVIYTLHYINRGFSDEQRVPNRPDSKPQTGP